MRTRLVNGLTGMLIAAAVTIISLACAKPSARAATDSTSGGHPPVPTGAVATDSLSKLADASRILGSPTAKVWVIEVSDFQCPYCKEWHDATFQTIVNDYVKTGKVRIAYVNFPLSIHQNAHQAAIAAMCVAAQDKFWQMHDALFASQSSWESLPDPAAAFDSLARSVGANEAAYHACLSTPSIAALVAGDQERARIGGVTATPSFWVAGKLIEGAIPTAAMKAAIDSALATAK